MPSGVQGYDRYAYVNNSPISHNDPSGHAPCVGDNYDDGPQCKKQNPIIYEAQGWQNACSKGQRADSYGTPCPNNAESAAFILGAGLLPEDVIVNIVISLGISQVASALGLHPANPMAIMTAGVGGKSVAEIVGDTDIQPNQPWVSAAKVGRYAENMKDGSFKWDDMGLNEEGKPDLIQIYQADNGKFLWSGNHRFVAAKLAGKEIPEDAINTEVIEGDFEPEVTGWEGVEWLP